jgi:hypothetical protein
MLFTVIAFSTLTGEWFTVESHVTRARALELLIEGDDAGVEIGNIKVISEA